ncbi:hypothetical protein [Novosphingobium soli]|uniref:Uncharacterized protein n=1 Tax=Novosphingobium soli TaxID=574956 RepID=A0ABV6CWG8_9SPHN
MSGQSLSNAPYGIDPGHCEVERWARMRTPLAIIVFALVLGSALLGFLGGGAPGVKAYASPAAHATLEYQSILRSGNWFETVLTVSPKADVKDLVVAIDQPLWRGMSIDTIAPDAESAEALDGTYSYHFGEVKAGEIFNLKFDGQIQPRSLRGLSGNIAIDDGERELMSIPVAITILP